MRTRIDWLCCFVLALVALACGERRDEPCTAADAASGRCQTSQSAPAPSLPGTVFADTCSDWHRPDGSCDPDEVAADFHECLNEKGLPEQQRLWALGRRSRSAMRARDRATYTCMELRRWVMSEALIEDWRGGPTQNPPPS